MNKLSIFKNIEVPTGNIICCNGSKGSLEFVSVGDYGKDINVKADFLGLHTPPKPFQHCAMLPLTEKWVITISTQYGCAMNCKFCDVSKVGSGKNATLDDLCGQIMSGLELHPDINYSQRLYIHFARMGEPSFNPNVLDCAKWLKNNLDNNYNIHPVVSTMMPKRNNWLKYFIESWMDIKNNLYKGNAGLQLSINSTNEKERAIMFNNNALKLEEISKIMTGIIPKRRKITLNFAIADYEINPQTLIKYFSPDNFVIKLTPMHKTKNAEKFGIKTNVDLDYTSYHPYEDIEKDLKNIGYDVIVFLASEFEDLSRITCGNAILSGTLPLTEYKEIKCHL